MGFINDLMSKVGLRKPSQDIIQKEEELKRQLFNSIAKLNPLDAADAAGNYFAEIKPYLKHIDMFDTEMSIPTSDIFSLVNVLSSNFAVIYWSEMINDDFEDAHNFLLYGFTELFSEEDFASLIEKNRSSFDALVTEFMKRSLILIRNRRHNLFKDILYVLQKLAFTTNLSAYLNKFHLKQFIEMLYDKAPLGEEVVWKDIFQELGIQKAKDSAQLRHSQAISDEIKKCDAFNSLADKILKHVATHNLKEIPNIFYTNYLESIEKTVGKKTLAFADKFGLTMPFLPVGSLAIPLVCLWYLDPGDRKSWAVTRIKGKRVKIRTLIQDNTMEILTFSMSLDELVIPEGYFFFDQKQTGALEKALVKSQGKYIFAVLPINKNEVTAAWIEEGSIDLTGNLQKGWVDIQNGDISKGCELLGEVWKTPYLADANYLAAMGVRGEGRDDSFQRSEDMLAEELKKCPHNYQAYSSMAITLKKQGMLEEAVKYFEKAHQIHPYIIAHLLSYASTLLSLDPSKHISEIFDLCTIAFEIDPRNGDTYQFLKMIDEMGIHLISDLPFLPVNLELC